MNYSELLKIISKQWANVNDIKKIASCGRDNASQIRDSIMLEIKQSGYNLPTSKEKIVPMQNVIQYFNLDIEYISNMALKEKILIN